MKVSNYCISRFHVGMARSKNFWARVAHDPQNSAHWRTEDIVSFSIRLAHGPRGVTRGKGGTVPRAPKTPKRPQVRTWGHNFFSCPGRHLTSVRPCMACWTIIRFTYKHNCSSDSGLLLKNNQSPQKSGGFTDFSRQRVVLLTQKTHWKFFHH